MNKAGEGPVTPSPGLERTGVMSADALVIPNDNRILYFGRDRAVFGFLSHFHLTQRGRRRAAARAFVSCDEHPNLW